MIYLFTANTINWWFSIPTVEMVMINRDKIYAEEMADIFEMVQDRLPCKPWDGIDVLGKVEIKHDVKIKIHSKEYPAHEYTNLMRKMKKFKDFLQVQGPFLGITYDPIVRFSTVIGQNGIERGVEVLRDYVYEDTVIYSCFGVPVSKNYDSALHTLGHLGGLRHHIEPIDIMYYQILDYKQEERKGFDKYFCDSCSTKLIMYAESIRYSR